MYLHFCNNFYNLNIKTMKLKSVIYENKHCGTPGIYSRKYVDECIRLTLNAILMNCITIKPLLVNAFRRCIKYNPVKRIIISVRYDAAT